MSNNPKEKTEDAASQEQHPHGEQGDTGHSGEGAASAMAHMISQDEQHRRQGAEPGDAAGSRQS